MPEPSDILVAHSPSMRRVRDLVARASTSNVTVLLVGEAGTGKALLARAIHAQSSRRGDFVTVDGGVLDAAEADIALHASAGGTLFVREVARLTLPLQLRLLRAAEQGLARSVGVVDDEPVDVRLVLAAHPGRMGRRAGDREGGARERLWHDLYRGRNVVVIEVPPLRDRREDIVPLARGLVRRMKPQLALGLSPAVERVLEAHDWPGNVRELEAAIAHAVSVTSGDQIEASALPRTLLRGGDLPPELSSLTYRAMLAASRERVSSEYFTLLLKEVSGNVTQAAARAGLERESLHRLLKRFGLNAEAFRPK